MSVQQKSDRCFLRAIMLDGNAAVRAWALISRHWKDIMFDFYELVFESNLGIRIDKADVPYLILRQHEHWTRLFTSSIDQDYIARINRMHARHMEVGLSSTTYIVSYLYLLGRFHDVVLSDTDDIAEARRLVAAIDAVVAEDLARALRAYNDIEYV